jgi:uridine kinase
MQVLGRRKRLRFRLRRPTKTAQVMSFTSKSLTKSKLKSLWDCPMSMRNEILGIIAEAVIETKLARPTRVAIDGRTASGKTSLADELAETLRNLGRNVIRTSIDGFHRPKADRYRQGQNSPRGYYEDARDLPAIKRLLLDPLGPNGDSLYRTASFDLVRDTAIEQEPHLAGRSDIFIVDGTFLQRPALSDLWDFVVFVDVTPEIAVERGAKRDMGNLGGYEKAHRLHSERYQAAFEIYRSECNPENSANVVLSNADFECPVLKFIRE